MSNFLKIILVICFLGSSVNITAQQKYADAYEKKGDEAFNKGNYTEALEHYTMGRKFLLNPVSLIYKCGEACRMLKDYDKAEYWYQKVLVEYDTLDINATFPLLYLHLAEVAKNNGNIVQAQHFLNTCLLDCPDIEIRKKAKQELNSIKWIFENNKEEENTIITNCGENINNAFSQSGCFIINDSLMFFTSPTYKEEIKTAYFGERLEGILQSRNQDLYGIVNGIDHDLYNPKNDQALASLFSANNLAGKKINKKKLQEYCVGLLQGLLEGISAVEKVKLLYSLRGSDNPDRNSLFFWECITIEELEAAYLREEFIHLL